MAVDDPGTIDIIGVERATGNIVLTISDHLDSADSEHHQSALQDKVNAYLRFIESGELLEHRAEAAGKHVVVRVVGKHRPDEAGALFLDHVRAVLKDAGFGFRYRISGIDAN